MARRSSVPIDLISPPLTQATLAPWVTEPTARPGTRRLTPTVNVPQTNRRVLDLDEVTRASGGRLHQVTGLEQLGSIYSKIADDLRAQVLVTIRTDPATKENDWREIDVALAGRTGDVRAPAGYYAR